LLLGAYRKAFHFITEDSKMKTGRFSYGTSMDLNALADFNLIATHGGFGKASRASGRSKATLSRHVSELEEVLGVRLIERGTHRLQLTEAGELLQARTEEPMHEVVDAAAAVREGLAIPRGRLRAA